MVHAEDHPLVQLFTAEVKQTGRQDLKAYTDSRPDFVEEQDILRAIWMAELLGCPLYIPHVTVGAGIDAAIAAKERGARIVLETCPHYLGLTADHEVFHGHRAGIGKVSPPLRDTENQDRLWEGLVSGDITNGGLGPRAYREERQRALGGASGIRRHGDDPGLRSSRSA